MFCAISSMYISFRFRATNSALLLFLTHVRVNESTVYLHKLIFLLEFVFDADDYKFGSRLNELLRTFSKDAHRDLTSESVVPV